METSIAEETLNLVGTIVSVDDLHQYDIPQEIIDIMKTWEVIYKSPYSNSFYNTTDIGWNQKPDGSLRVSNHWNFSSSTTKYTGRIHCKTSKIVCNNSKYTLGKYNSINDTYRVLMSRLTVTNQNRIDFKKSDENISNCREFSNRIKNNEIYASFEFEGKEYSGRINKLSKSSIRLVDENDNVIISANNSSHKITKFKNLILFDKNNQVLTNPYIYEN